MISRTLLCKLLLLLSLNSIALAGVVKKAPLDYENNFAIFIQVSSINDLYVAQNLYLKLDKHYKGEDPVYLITPLSDFGYFNRALNQFFNKNSQMKIKKNIIINDGILEKCQLPVSIEYIKTKHPFIEQQIVKLCLGRTRIAKHYLILKPNINIIKDFNKDLFYDSNGVLKIQQYFDQYDYSLRAYNPYQKAQNKQMANNTAADISYNMDYSLWSSEIILNLNKNIIAYGANGSNSNFYQLFDNTNRITAEDYYGQYLYYMERSQYTPMDNIGTLNYRKYNLSNDFAICRFILKSLHDKTYKEKYFEIIPPFLQFNKADLTFKDILQRKCQKKWYYKIMQILY